MALGLVSALGCGGDELSVREFAAKGNTICKADDRSAIGIQDQAPFTEFQAIPQLEDLIALAKEENSELEDLNEPERLSEPVAAYLAARSEAIALMQKGIDAASVVDFNSFERLQAELAQGEHARAKLADRVGLTACSRMIPPRFNSR